MAQWLVLESPSYTTWWQQTVLLTSFYVMSRSLVHHSINLGMLPLSRMPVETRIIIVLIGIGPKGWPYSVEMVVEWWISLSDILDVVRFLYPKTSKTVHWKLGLSSSMHAIIIRHAFNHIRIFSSFFELVIFLKDLQGFLTHCVRDKKQTAPILSSKLSWKNCVPEAAEAATCANTQVASVGMGTVVFILQHPTFAFRFLDVFIPQRFQVVIAMVTKPLNSYWFWKGVWSNPNEFGNVNDFTFGVS